MSYPIEVPSGRMEDVPAAFAVDPFDHLVADQDTTCKVVLEAWIRAWPVVSEWKFDASFIGSTVQVCSTRVTADGRVWASRDRILSPELLATDLTRFVEIRARKRFDEFQAASAALVRETA